MFKDPFVTLIFHGKRFAKAAMPVRALPELVAYRELVVAIAKALFQRAHPDRKRLPKGFDEGFQLVLERIDPGSAVPIVSRVRGDQVVIAMDDLYDQARDLLQSGLEAVNDNRPLPEEFTREILARFNTFGRTLSDDDWITVARPGQVEGARYDRAIRRQLVLHAQATYEDEVNIIGEVRAADKDAEGFAIRDAEGRKIEVHGLSPFFPIAVRSLEESALVRVRGFGQFSADGVLQKVTDATDVSLAEEGDEPTRSGCATSVSNQLESLKALQVGWYDASSPAFEASSLEWLASLLTAVLDGFHLPRPFIYPTPEGAARAEWSIASWDVIGTFDLASRSVDVLASHVRSEELHEISVHLAEPGGESKLGRFLSEHLGAAH